MGSDLRTSARDLLILAQRVSTLLQQQSDKLLKGHSPAIEAKSSELCQQPIDLRQKVQETSKLLQEALEHVEDIDDEDEARILREPMDVLQIHIKEALQIASSEDVKAALAQSAQVVRDSGLSRSSTDAQRSPAVPIGFASKSPIGMMAPGTPPLSASVNRHSLGLFSTSPKFSAQTQFSAPGRASTSRLSASVSLEASATGSPLTAPVAVKTSKPVFSLTQPAASTLTAVSDGPLSITTTLPPPIKSSIKGTRVEASLDSATISSSCSSVASFSTAITSPLDVPPPAPCKKASTSTANAAAKETDDAAAKKAVPKLESSLNLSQRRRVPRGLFSSVSTSEAWLNKSTLSGSGLSSGASGRHASVNGSSAITSGEVSVGAANFSRVARDGPLDYSEGESLERNGLHSPQLSRTHVSEGSCTYSLVSQPQSPQARDSSFTATSVSSPSTPISGLETPTSPRHLQRSQPKPSPIQTSIEDGHGSRMMRSVRKQDNNDEEISQLARDLERAMNPTPTEPVPQPYFLQGKGLLQRIPSQVSMDDGLLDEDYRDHLSEDSDRTGAQEWQDEEGSSGLTRSNSGSSLRRQRSGRRRFMISRSRSRNRSKGRQESARNSKTVLMPIEIGYPCALTSSEWPFDKSPPQQQSLSVLQSQHERQRHLQSQHRYSAEAQSRLRPSSALPQSRSGPHLPFAESVTIGNPVRVGRGINSFTVYTVALTLCDPVKSRVTSSSTRNRSRDVPSRTGQVGQWDTGMHAGHAPAGSSFTNNQTPVERSETRRCGGQNSMTGERTPLDHRPPLGRSASSKASLMMTRSMSFPELGYSAERLLMEVARVDEAPPLPGSEPPTSFTNTQNSESVSATESPAGPPRVIHVRKRYSDFVALRARLVETYRDPGSGGSPRGRPMFPRASIASSAMPRVSPYNPLPIHHPSRDSEGEDGAYADEYSRGGVDAHSQPMSSTSTTNAIVSCSSIIRGMPKLPPKKVVGKFRPAFVERRRRELEYFLEWVVAHPIIGDCPVVVQWFLGQT